MIETRLKEIQDIIVNKENLQSIYDFIRKHYEDSIKNNPHASFLLRISCDDYSSYESESDGLLKNGDIVDLKKCYEIDFKYTDFKAERGISLSLKHGRGYDISNFIVRGNDRDWVQGRFNGLIELINSFEKQNSCFIKHKHLFLHLVALFSGRVIFSLSGYFSPFIFGKNGSELNEKGQAIRNFLITPFYLNWAVVWMLCWLIGLIFAYPFRDWFFKKYFPVVEFNFGPEFTKIEKNKRAALFTVGALIVLPFMLSIFYDFFKGLFR